MSGLQPTWVMRTVGNSGSRTGTNDSLPGLASPDMIMRRLVACSVGVMQAVVPRAHWLPRSPGRGKPADPERDAKGCLRTGGDRASLSRRLIVLYCSDCSRCPADSTLCNCCEVGLPAWRPAGGESAAVVREGA